MRATNENNLLTFIEFLKDTKRYEQRVKHLLDIQDQTEQVFRNVQAKEGPLNSREKAVTEAEKDVEFIKKQLESKIKKADKRTIEANQKIANASKQEERSQTLLLQLAEDAKAIEAAQKEHDQKESRLNAAEISYRKRLKALEDKEAVIKELTGKL